MDLRQLRYFVAVAEELHFGRAAERLGITQPPLSQAIQALEAEIGVELLTRTRRSVALTPVGAQWLTPVRRLLDEASGLPELARQLARGEIGTLRLAFVSTAAYSVLPALVRSFKQRFPDVEIALQEATSDVQMAALVNGEIDAGLIIPPPQAAGPARLGYRSLLREPLVLAVPEDWVVSGRIPAGRDGLRLDDIVDAPLIIFPRRSAPAFYDIVIGYYAGQGTQPRIGQEAIQMQTIISLVSAGMGLAWVPRSLQKMAREGVRYMPLAEGAPEIETGLMWLQENASPALARLREMVFAAAFGGVAASVG